MDDTVNQIVTDACANNGALLHYLVMAVLGVPVVASMLANLRKILPPGIAAVLDVVGLNFIKSAAAQAAAHQQAKGGPTP